MKRPKKVVIGQATWRIDWSANRLDIVDAETGERRYGCTNAEHRLIRVRGSVSLDLQRETLLHELLHAVTTTYNVRWVKGDDPEDREERMITVLAPLIVGVMRDNPQVMRFLTAD